MIFRSLVNWLAPAKKAVQPEVVPEPKFAHTLQVHNVMKQRNRERSRKFQKFLSEDNISLVYKVLTDQQAPMDYKIRKGTRDELAIRIMLALAKKNA
jgi:hypothetical protein